MLYNYNKNYCQIFNITFNFLIFWALNQLSPPFVVTLTSCKSRHLKPSDNNALVFQELFLTTTTQSKAREREVLT
jgi:hypothetical protein